MKKTFSYFLRYWPVALLSVAALACESLCDLTQPTLLAQMIDQGVAARDTALVLHYAVRMLSVTALGMLFAITRATLSSNVSQRFGRDVRLALYQKIQRLSLSKVDGFERASLVTRATNDATQVQNFINGMMRFFLKAPILCVGGIIMAAQLSQRMAMALYIIVPVCALIVFASIKVGYPYFYRVQAFLDKLNANVREYLSGVRVVKAFNRFAYEDGRFSKSNDELTTASQSAMRVTSFFGPAISLVMNLGIAAVIMLGGFYNEDQGKVIAFINYMAQIMHSLGMFSNIFNQLVRALVSGRRMEAVLTEDEGMDLSGDKPLDAIQNGIRFDHVSFTYEGTSAPALTDIDFSVRRGETLGIIGSTGSGKSTLINLIPRFYDVSDGSISVDGVNIRELDIRRLRDRIAIVPQVNLLFSGTIESNLRWGKQDATEDELWDALKKAQAHDFVAALPEGLRAPLGQRGVNLSGGQKQRISIARALIKAPDALILDDCTSALDVTTEAAIRKELRELPGGMITIMISQRITSIMGADRILVLDQGRLVGQGRHDELMERCEVYRDIYVSQIGKEVARVG